MKNTTNTNTNANANNSTLVFEQYKVAYKGFAYKLDARTPGNLEKAISRAKSEYDAGHKDVRCTKIECFADEVGEKTWTRTPIEFAKKSPKKSPKKSDEPKTSKKPSKTSSNARKNTKSEKAEDDEIAKINARLDGLDKKFDELKKLILKITK